SNEAALAIYLANLGMLLHRLGRDHEALAPIREAIGRFRAAAAGQRAYEIELSEALGNYGGILSRLSRPTEGVIAVREAVGLLRAGATDQPELAGLRQLQLARALESLSMCLSALDSREAIESAEESVALLTGFAAFAPKAHQPQLARMLHNLV